MSPRLVESTQLIDPRFPGVDQDWLTALKYAIQSDGFTCINQAWTIFELQTTGELLCEYCAQPYLRDQERVVDLLLVQDFHLLCKQPRLDEYACHRCQRRVADIQPINDCDKCMTLLIRHVRHQPLYTVRKLTVQQTFLAVYPDSSSPGTPPSSPVETEV